MKISVPKERRPHERRVAASPDSVKRLLAMGLEPVVERGAGEAASFSDEAYKAAGATIAASAAEAVGAADIVLKVQRPLPDELRAMKRGAVLIGMLAPLQHGEDIASYASAGIAAFAMELVPRITRAQSMDVLSSQANLAGYRIVLEAASAFGRAFPMMMTAAGTIPPTRVLVMGAETCSNCCGNFREERGDPARISKRRWRGNCARSWEWRRRLGRRCTARGTGIEGWPMGSSWCSLWRAPNAEWCAIAFSSGSRGASRGRFGRLIFLPR